MTLQSAPEKLVIGMDVGSTTVKAAVIDPVTKNILWNDYQRHHTKQPEKVLEFCKRFETEIPGFDAKRSRMFITGSGGNGMAKYLGAKFVQEVNAVTMAVEQRKSAERNCDRTGFMIVIYKPREKPAMWFRLNFFEFSSQGCEDS